MKDTPRVGEKINIEKIPMKKSWIFMTNASPKFLNALNHSLSYFFLRAKLKFAILLSAYSKGLMGMPSPGRKKYFRERKLVRCTVRVIRILQF